MLYVSHLPGGWYTLLYLGIPTLTEELNIQPHIDLHNNDFIFV